MANLGESTKIVLGAARFLAIAGALIYFGWEARGVREELTALRTDLQILNGRVWTVRDMRDYVSDAERLNRKLQRADGALGVVMPDPVMIHARNALTAP